MSTDDVNCTDVFCLLCSVPLGQIHLEMPPSTDDMLRFKRRRLPDPCASIMIEKGLCATILFVDTPRASYWNNSAGT